MSQHNDTSPPPTPPAGRRISPAMLFGLVLLGALAGAVVMLPWFVGRPLPELTEAALDAAEERWSERGPANYDLDLEIQGAQPGDVHVEVRGGRATAFQRDGRTPAQQRTWEVWTVPGQFEMIERELELAADPVHEMQTEPGTQLGLRCEFDPDYGYPRQFHRMVFGGGPEVYWRVTDFQSR